MTGKYGTFGSMIPARSPGSKPFERSRGATRALPWSTVFQSRTVSSSLYAGSSGRSLAVVVCRVARFNAFSSGRTAFRRLGERRVARDVTAHDQRLHRLGALVGVDGLDVGHVADDVVLEQDPVAAEQIARLGDDLPRLARVVELRQAGDGGGGVARLREPADLHAVKLHAGDLSEHMHEPLLHDLEGGERLAELLPLRHVDERGVVGGDGVAERGPRALAAGSRQHLRGVLERLGPREALGVRDPDAL